MDQWGFVPLPAAAVFLAVAAVAAAGRGAPRGRTALMSAGIGGALLFGALAWILSGDTSSILSFAYEASNAALLLSLPAWVALALRFGTAKGQSGGWAVLVPLACAVDLALILAGAFAPAATRIELERPQSPILLDHAAARGAAGAFLLVGAFGVLRAQALWEAARLAGMEKLRRAYAGLVLSLLTIFLFASQTLLYGAASLRILALASLVFVPSLGVLLPVLRSSDGAARTLPAHSRPVASSAVLMGLGGFLILLAGIGEFMTRFAPAGRVLWFQWGGSILVGVYGALWLVPGIRHRLRRWLRVPDLSRRYQWDPSPLLAASRPHKDGPTSMLLGALFQGPQGRPAIALWLRSEGGGYAPWVASASPLPLLGAGNPLLEALRRERGLLDLTRPPGRLALVPAYVENLALVEQAGFRLFLSLRAGEEDFGLLALAPRDRSRAPEDALALDLYRGELALLSWGAVVAWGGGGEEREEDRQRLLEAAESVRRMGAAAAARSIAPAFGARISAAAEEVARNLAARASRGGAGAPSAPAGNSLATGPAAGALGR